jgi:multidrug resistance efflux pump
MEVLLLGIYSAFVWLIFIKLKLLPWNIVSQVIVITIPIIGLTILILLLNIVAPSTHDIRVVNYVVPVVPRVTGRVIEVPIEPNRHIKKGDILFKIDPEPFQYLVDALTARLAADQAKLAADEARLTGDESKVVSEQANFANTQAGVVGSEAGSRELIESQAELAGKVAAAKARLELSKMRIEQYRSLAESGAGDRFAQEQAEADVRQQEGELAAAVSAEAQVKQKLSAQINGELSDVASAKARQAQAKSGVDIAQAQVQNSKAQVAISRAQIENTKADLSVAKWNLEQCVYYAPADGTVVALALRPGTVAAIFPMLPVMTFVEDEQWILAIYHQNEVRKVEPGQEAEVAFEMHPGRVVKCTVDSIMWATGQGQLPIGGGSPAQGGVAPIPADSLAVRLLLADQDKDLFLAAGAHGDGAIYTDSGHAIHILRKVLVRVSSKLKWLIPKLH